MKYLNKTLAAILGLYLATGATFYVGCKKLERSIDSKLSESHGSIMGQLNEMEMELDELTKDLDRLYELEKKIVSRRIIGFEQNPAEFAILGVSEGSRIDGKYKKGGTYKVRTPVKDEKFVFVQPVLRGEDDVGLIRLRLGNGDFYGRPGEPIEVSLTSEEMRTLKEGDKIPYQVSALSASEDSEGSPHPFWKIKGSYRANFVMEGTKNIMKNSIGS